MTAEARPPRKQPDYLEREEGRNEILVVSPHAELVIKTLQDFGIAEPAVEVSSLLGLTRLTFPELTLPNGVREQSDKYLERTRNPARDATDLIGILLSAVKESTIARWGGWVPTMGRNRLVGHVTGTNGGPIVSGEPPKWIPDIEGDRLGQFPNRNEFSPTGRNIPPHGAVRLGMVDTAIHRHPKLEGIRILPQPGELVGAEATTFRASHATAIAGVVIQKANDAEIAVEGALSGDGWTTSWDAANAIASFALSGIDILNLSFSCYTTDGLPPLALSTAIDRLDPRIVVVAAAGNFGDTDDHSSGVDLKVAPAWPAALDDVIAVGAAVRGSEPGSFTTAKFSPKTPWVDVVAEGTGVLSIIIARPEGAQEGSANDTQAGRAETLPAKAGYARWSGTSLATAVVAGTIAELMVSGNLSARIAWSQLEKTLRTNGAAAGASPGTTSARLHVADAEIGYDPLVLPFLTQAPRA